MPSIDTLATDVQRLFGQTLEGHGTLINDDILAKFGVDVAMHVADSLRARTGTRKPNTLYMSEVGQPCMRKLWYSLNAPLNAESMQDHTLYKFLFGNLVEEVTLLLAEAAGHTVERRQARVEWEVKGFKFSGRMDAVIDGVMVDVKSCSPYGFKKFQQGLNDSNDSFGYRTQLSSYNGLNTPAYDRQGFLAVDKQNGHVGFFEYEWESPLKQMHKAADSVRSATPPDRRFQPIPEGKSGNMKLCVECSYCPFKHTCWADANGGKGLAGYVYSTGPIFLTEVKRPPNVMPLAA